MSFVFIPLYIKFLGIEAYGLIGFYTMMQGMLLVLDLGLSQTMNRELARYSVVPDKASEARDLSRTLEVGYWTMGIVIGVAIVALAPLIAGNWIKSGSLPVSTVQRTVRIMGMVAAIQWPASFYIGGLMGLQRQMQINIVRICMSSLGSGGAVVIMWLVYPTITAFFTWQILVAVLNVTVMGTLFWRSLPTAGRPARFDLGMMRSKWRFAAGMTGISLSAIILTQLDKLILSKMLSLEMFGYYVLASAVCNVIPNMLVGPVFNALFPRFSSLVALNDDAALKTAYHQSSQLVAVIVLSVAIVLSMFAPDILLLWTRNQETTRMAAPIVRILVIGMALNGIMSMPYALQLAHGWTSLGFRIALLLIVALVPAIIFMTLNYGAVGAASAGVLLNAMYIAIGAPLTHRRLLKGELSRWAVKDIGAPVLAALLAASLGRLLTTSPMTPFHTLATVGTVFFITATVASMSATHIRSWIFMKLFRTRAAHV